MRIESDGAVGPYERVVIASDARSGLRCVVAVHSTALGPGVGGTRFRAYACESEALIDRGRAWR
jgi:valine dehydrogenase (NAD+)